MRGWSKSSALRLLAEANLLSRKFISAAMVSIAVWRSFVALLFLFAFSTCRNTGSMVAFLKVFVAVRLRLEF